jgi:diguanylate cyclase (GGDEF)-like protein
LALAAAVGAFWGWIMGRASGGWRRQVQDAQAQVAHERIEADRVIARLRRHLEESQSLSKEQSEIFQLLPELIREMFAAHKRGLADLALKLVDKLLQPDHSALFAVRRPRSGVLDRDFAAPGPRLVAVAVNGLKQPLPESYEIEFGQGRIGYAAQHRAVMDAADFAALGGHVARVLDADPPGLRVDVVVPIEEEGGLMGMLCIGGARKRLGQEKRLLRMVAELTAVATIHMQRLRESQEAADRDGLTGVFNKRYLQKRLGDEVHATERRHVPLSLLILDIDHFKHYNDTNGHLEGDEVLKQVGELLRKSIREDDVAARYGGEEFIVLYPGANKAVAMRHAESLRQAVADFPFAHRGSQPLGTVTISGGVATFPEDSRNGVDLIRCADQALYEAKAKGRNCVLPAAPTYLT